MRPSLLAAIAGVVVAVAPVAVAGASSAARETKSPCVPTPVTIKANDGLALCGPATAVVRAGGKTYTYTHGFCATLGKIGFQLSLGTAIPMADGNAGKPYFSVDVNTKTLHASGFAYAGGKKAVPAGVFKIAGHITSRASFSGTNSGGAFSGSWNCHGVVATE
ncbi:MAG: hypothetical protein ABI317_01855 [Gaiellales bacterium]